MFSHSGLKDLSAIVMGQNCGKSSLCTALNRAQMKPSVSKSAKSHVFIDVDAYALKKCADQKEALATADGDRDIQWELDMFTALVDKLKEDIKKFKGASFTIVTRNWRFVKFLEIKKYKVYVPTPDHFETLYAQVEADAQKSTRISYAELLFEHVKGKHTGVYSSFKELVGLVADHFGLEVSLDGIQDPAKAVVTIVSP